MTVSPLNEDEQLAERGGEIVRAAALSVEAPMSLRERIESDREKARPARRRGRRLRFGAAAVGLVAAAAIVVAATSGGSSSSNPTVLQAAALGLRPATAPAPSRDPSKADDVKSHEGRIQFPYWADRTAWLTSGQRTDVINGHHATTVFYTTPSGVRLSYTVIAMPALTVPSGRWVDKHFVVLRVGDRNLVTWREDGQTCVIGAPAADVTQAQLVALAQSDVDA